MDWRIPEAYKGREQAFVKHQILKAYLERLFMIIGQHRSTITYVDCFAGPWQDESPNLATSSIGIAAEVMRKCRNTLLSRFDRKIAFRALFIEKNKGNYARLEVYLDSLTDIETKPIHGDFANAIPDIVDFCNGGDFSFIFLDPKGWRQVGASTIGPLLEIQQSEFLINLMYDFVNRVVRRPDFAAQTADIFGAIPELEEVPPDERRAHLLGAYRKNIKRLRQPHRSWTAFVPILRPDTERILYYLIYCTSSPKGIDVFTDVSSRLEEAAEAAATLARIRRREGETNTQDLFDDNPITTRVKPVPRDRVDLAADYWSSILSSQPTIFGINELADIVDSTDFSRREIQAGLKHLIDGGKASNLDVKRKRPVNHVDFRKGERLAKL